jgi:hypothetical protein
LQSVTDRNADSEDRNSGRGAQSPSDAEEVKLKEPTHVAAGIPAVVQSLKFTLRHTGLTRGLGSWRKINKTKGFDCQSCAWPAADEDRNFFELCESGAKAFASEATKKPPGSVFDRDFIDQYTTGFSEFVENLRTTSWDDILAGSGLTRDQIRAAAEIAMRSERTICCWAMGLTQHKNAVATIQEVMNVLLLRGNIGRPGADLVRCADIPMSRVIAPSVFGNE